MKKKYLVAEYLLRIIASTWKISTSAKIPNSPSVIAFWHGEMLPVWKLFSQKKACAVVSLNKDGEILAHLLNKWKYKLIRGSSSRKGKEVIDEIVNECLNDYILITPDGPRGPRRQNKAGAFVIAQRKQIPLYFLKCTISKKKTFNKSWDKFILPLPFCKIHIDISDKIIINKDADREHISLLMQKHNGNDDVTNE